MSKVNLRKLAANTPDTMTKFWRGEEVTLSMLGRICKILDMDYEVCEGVSLG